MRHETRGAHHKSNNSKDALPALKNIKEDIEALQSDIFHLAGNLRDVTADRAQDAAGYVNERVDDLRNTGTMAMKKAETGIKAKPGQSLTIAFIVGAALSYFLYRNNKS